MRAFLTIIPVFFLLFSCKIEKKEEAESLLPSTETEVIAVEYAKGFTIEKYAHMTVIEVKSPWPNSNRSFKYALVERDKLAAMTLPKDAYDAIVPIPVEKLVVTSTTHIPSLEALGIEDKLVGFPSTKYISSEKTRQNVDSGKVKEIGSNESINTEVLIDLQPDVVVGFSINDQNKTYETIQKSGIPVLYNGDWVEETPLGKAEWIKFFAPFFKLEDKAGSIFNNIESEYQKARELAKMATSKPTVISGAMYRDIWYIPAGDSWAASFLADANCDYLWKDTSGTGSLSLSIESVLEKGEGAEYWIAPNSFNSYDQLRETNEHYTRFEAFKNKKVYTFSLTTGDTGGILYYELGPNRPDIILKDLISILHPDILPDYQPYFFKPLNP